MIRRGHPVKAVHLAVDDGVADAVVGGVQTGLTVVVHEPDHASKIPLPYGVLDLLPHIGGGQGVAGGLLLIAEITVELRQQLQHLSPLGARGGAATGGGFHVLLVADLGVPGQDPRPRGVVLAEGLGKDLLHDGLHRQSEVAVVCHAEVVKHLSEEEVVIPAPVAASHVVDAHIGDGTRIEQVFHLGQQGSASALGVAAPFLGGGLLHVPHGGPMLDRLNPAQRVEPRVLQIEVGVGKGLVQVFIRGLDVKIFKLLAVEFLDPTQLGGGVKGSQIHSLLPVIGEAQHDPGLALRGIALREGATFFSVMHGEGHIALHAGHHAASLTAALAADDDGRAVLGEGGGAVFTVDVLSSHMLVGGKVHEG